jgi:hypothetical protein
MEEPPLALKILVTFWESVCPVLFRTPYIPTMKQSKKNVRAMWWELRE